MLNKLVPTQSVGMPSSTLRVGGPCASVSGRRAARTAFPRRAWERNHDVKTIPIVRYCGSPRSLGSEPATEPKMGRAAIKTKELSSTSRNPSPSLRLTTFAHPVPPGKSSSSPPSCNAFHPLGVCDAGIGPEIEHDRQDRKE